MKSFQGVSFPFVNFFANIISAFFHWDTFRLMRQCHSTPFGDSNLGSIDDKYTSQHLGQLLEKQWVAECLKAKERGGKGSLRLAIFKVFWLHYSVSGIMLFISSLIRASQPLLILKIIQYFTPGYRDEAGNVNLWMAILIVINVARGICFYCYMKYGRITGMNIRLACSYLIFRKMLKKTVRTSVKLHPLNLLSNDVGRFDLVILQLHWLWVGGIFFLVTFGLLYYICGEIAVVCAVILYAAFFVLQTAMAKCLGSLRRSAGTATDRRLRLMTEVIGGIQIIKLYGWEEPFKKLIKKARGVELSKILTAAAIRGIIDAFPLFYDRVQMVLILLGFAIFQKNIAVFEIFGILLMMITARQILSGYLPMAVTFASETKASIERLQTFLELEELKTESHSSVENKNVPAPGSIVLKNVTALWSPESAVLTNISLSVAPASLCSIVGPVGSGKTSLLHVLLSELRPSKGVMELGGSVSYAAQEPWTFHGTVRENILFGEELDQARYDEVIRVCALKTDLEQLSHGDGTFVGERGVKLSGGQRARISLARAVYRKADIYLLDDPLSAVDAHVSRHLFSQCIQTFLKDKTRILVTHQVQVLTNADHVVLLEKGKIRVQGSFQELSESGFNFGNCLNFEESQSHDKASSKNEGDVADKPESIEDSASEGISQFVENRSQWSDLVSFFVNGSGWWGSTGLVLNIVIMCVVLNTFTYVVSCWPEFTKDKPVHERLQFVLILTYLLIAAMLSPTFRAVFNNWVLLKSSRWLHNRMLTSALNTSLSFFQLIPAGTVLGHFSEDVGVLDEQLPRSVDYNTQAILFTVVNTILVCVINYYTTPCMVLAGAALGYVAKVVIRCARSVKIMENSKRNAVYSHVADTLNGSTSIRAMGKINFVQEKFNKIQDCYTSAKLFGIDVYSTQIYYIVILSTAMISINTIIFVKAGHWSDPALLGIGFFLCMHMEDLFGLLIEHMSNLLSLLPSLKNALDIVNLPSEKVVELTPAEEISEKWPSTGNIEFNNVFLQYGENGPPVLKDLSFKINSGEKIGVVGRTGAGKSSLVAAILRMATPQTDGSLLIDAVDVRAVPLSLLRRSITVIPQDPVLFSGTMRYNLDPFNEMEDEKLWSALRHVELAEHVENLDAPVEERGGNWSVGQRQLLCLARASLRNSRILVLDEATASIDHETDALIQRAIRSIFKECTVITIAHRLNTIMDSDRVLVMDAGHVAEYDHPHKLLLNNTGHLYKLVCETGRDMMQQLMSVAKNAYKKIASDEVEITKL